MEADDAPLCAVCQHHHFQGVKCETCGHIGKTDVPLRLFPNWKGPFPVPSPEPPPLPLVFGFVTTKHSEFKLCCMIRNKVFLAQGDSPQVKRQLPTAMAAVGGAAGGGAGALQLAAEDAASDSDAVDDDSGHVLARVGDAPVGTCRLRPLPDPMLASAAAHAGPVTALASAPAPSQLLAPSGGW